MESFKITKIRSGSKETIKDSVAEEVPFTLFIGDKELATLLCSPLDLEDLVRGFLFTSGLVNRIDKIKKIVINEEEWVAYIDMAGTMEKDLMFKRLYTSGCGKGTLFYSALDIAYRSKVTTGFKIKNSQVNVLMADFQKRSQLYLKTGGVHSAALADENGILIFREDIGRHNAIDKVIGRALLENNSFEDRILLTSGRISSEVLLKARKCGISIVASKSAPTNQAVRLAREMEITLIGFARGNRMNIYSAEERIIA